MKIAELFVNLGLKGADNSKKALIGVDKALGGVKESGLAAKAMIVAVVYGLERMMSHSAQTGQGLVQFSNYLGMSAESLQRYQFAGRQVGIANEEMMGTFKALNDSMTNIKLGKGAPEGLGFIAKALAEAGEGIDRNKALSDPSYLFEKLNQFAKLDGIDRDMANRAMKSMGLSENIIQGMRRNAFTPEMMAKANIYSDREAQNLARVNAQWENLGNNFKMMIGHLTAKHGEQIIKDLTEMTKQLVKMIEQAIILADKLKVFDAISSTMKSTAGVMETTNLMLDTESKEASKVKKESAENLKKFANSEEGQELRKKQLEISKMSGTEKFLNAIGPFISPFKDLSNKIDRSIGLGKESGTTSVNQTINFVNSENPLENAKAQKEAAQKYLNVSPSQRGGI